jgi:hypothetical protein
MQAGNWKDAYEGFRKPALGPKANPEQVGSALANGIQCLDNLGRVDDFREGVMAVHAKHWRLLETAAQTYTPGEHFG